MARFEQHREDLLREATALVERVEVELPGHADPVIIGFRRDGGASFYFGADPAIQFNAAQEFRRGYDEGRLLKAERGQIIAMRRVRDEQAVVLKSWPLSAAELADYCRRVQTKLWELQAAIHNGEARVTREVPEQAAVLTRVGRWLESMPEKLAIAARPNAGPGNS